MGKKTAITWTDHTFNPWWGCLKISEECANCYAATFDKRVGGDHWGPNSDRRFFGEAHWREPLKWNKAAEVAGERRRVFCASMADVFEDRRDLDPWRTRLWRLIEMTPALDWLLLTKRPEMFPAMLPWMNPSVLPEPLCRDCADSDGYCVSAPTRPCDLRAPWANVWLGVTCGVRDSLSRVLTLREVPAVVRFVSCEPILEHITASDWSEVLRDGVPLPDAKISWLIVGDESGHKHRPAQADWIRTAREAALRHGVAFHFKQWCGADVGGIVGKRVGGKIHLPMLDGRAWAEFPRSSAPLRQEVE